MRSPAISTVIKMMESFSAEKQDKIVEHLSEYIQNLQDEQKWDDSFQYHLLSRTS